MKIKIFRKIFILIVLFLAFSINNSFAENRSIDDIKREMEVLKKDFENSKNDLEKREINEKFNELLILYLDKQWKLIYNDRRLRWPNYDVVWDLKTWDILVFKNKWDDSFSTKFIWWWNHAVIAYDSSTFVDIGSFRIPSAKVHIDEIYARINSWYYDKIALLKMDLSWWQQRSIKNYINSNLLWKEYDDWFNKWTANVLYCSELVWRAHLYSWKYINLDADWWPWVEPSDFIKSTHVKQVIYDSF